MKKHYDGLRIQVLNIELEGTIATSVIADHRMDTKNLKDTFTMGGAMSAQSSSDIRFF